MFSIKVDGQKLSFQTTCKAVLWLHLWANVCTRDLKCWFVVSVQFCVNEL